MSNDFEQPVGGPAASRRLTIRQERFAQMFLTLGSAAEAYRRAYDAANMAQKTTHEVACRLLRDRKVAARIKQLRDQMAQEFGISRMALFIELDEAYAIAKADRKAAAMIAATMGKARLAGFIEHAPTPAKDRPLVLPAGDLLGAHDKVMAAVATGEISTREAHELAGLLECRRRLMETVAFDQRLAAIEARLPNQQNAYHRR